MVLFSIRSTLYDDDLRILGTPF